MKRKIPVILIFLIFVLGIGLLSYPLVSEWYNGRAQTTVIENYNHAAAGLNPEQAAAMREAAREYNEGLLGTIVLTDPFDVEISEAATAEYMSLLDVNGDGVMGSVRIPGISVTLPIYHGTSHKVLEKGAGHLENTSLPIGGIGTHAIISAHSGLPASALFTDLEKLSEGDLFFLDVLDEMLAYRVDQIKVVEPEDTSDLLIDISEDYVTLVTCTPYGINSHRLLVRGVRTEYEEALSEEIQTKETVLNPWNRPYIIAGIILILFLILYTTIRLIKRRKARRHGQF